MPLTLSDILNSHRTGTPVIMGILNVTPDSFSDGGAFLAPAAAREQAARMLAEGADIIDIGAESTRPGSLRVPPREQLARLAEVLPAVAAAGATVSIDTTSAQVAEFALRAGARIVNDISAGRDDPDMLALLAAHSAPLVLMHMLGQPGTMQDDPRYADVVAEVREFLRERMDAAVAAGVRRENIIVDPGIGFGKTTGHNLALLAGLGELAALDRPILIGASRKRFIGDLTGRQTPADRLHGSLAASLDAFRRGATIFRVHDVAPLRASLTVAAAIRRGGDKGDQQKRFHA